MSQFGGFAQASALCYNGGIKFNQVNHMETNPTADKSASSADRPKIISVGDLIRGTWSDWRQNWQKFAYLLVIPLSLSYLIGLISYVFKNNLIQISWPWWLLALAFVIFIALTVIVAVLYVSAYVSEFLLLKDLAQTVNFENLRGWYRRAKPYFWITIAVSFIFAVLAVFFTILLIIPGIIFSVFYCFAIYAVMFEDHKFEGAFGRSRELVRGYWWPVFGRILAAVAIVYLFYLVVGGIFAGIIWLISSGLQLQSSKELFSLLYNLLSIFVGIVVGPLSLIYTYKIYKSLKEIKNLPR